MKLNIKSETLGMNTSFTIKKSEILWTTILASIMIIISYIYPFFLFPYSIIAFVFGLLGLMNADIARGEKPPVLWLLLTPTLYALFVILLIQYLCIKVYNKVIKPINRKIDGD